RLARFGRRESRGTSVTEARSLRCSGACGSTFAHRLDQRETAIRCAGGSLVLHRHVRHETCDCLVEAQAALRLAEQMHGGIEAAGHRKEIAFDPMARTRELLAGGVEGAHLDRFDLAAQHRDDRTVTKNWNTALLEGARPEA